MKHKTVLGTVLAASLLALGSAASAAQLPPRGDLDRDGIQNRWDNDRDGDGIANRSDPNPNVYNRTRVIRGHDRDGDGIADRSDRDRDGDRVPNSRDRAPDNPRRS
jgi:hypothetical protein